MCNKCCNCKDLVFMILFLAIIVNLIFDSSKLVMMLYFVALFLVVIDYINSLMYNNNKDASAIADAIIADETLRLKKCNNI